VPTPPGTGQEVPGICGEPQIVCTLPMVDTSRVAAGGQPSGGISAFRGSSDTVDIAGTGLPVGRLVQVTSLDAPQLGWSKLHSTTQNPWAVTSGTITFREFLVGYSSDFLQTYLSMNQAQWIVNAAGVNDGTKWVKSSSPGVTGDRALGAVGSAAVQVRGLSYLREFTVGYNP
jgi:hypothetical protein